MRKNFNSTIVRFAVQKFGSIEEYARSPLNAFRLLFQLLAHSNPVQDAKSEGAKKSSKKEVKRRSPATSPRKCKNIWTDVLSQKNILECLSKSQNITIKQQYSHYTNATPGYFDPSAQYGGCSIANMERRGEGARYKFVAEDLNELKEQQREHTIPTNFPERVGWFSTKDYFANNCTGSAIYRSPSPSKITTKR
eukprot:TRINITY_DN2068_c0_g2_i1.p1 TRINITY_DN2068_c0_g2~~TRINITY_DN2068_c0_g2_i1.p1  ORF type:complete len:194 (+),score=34.06 TRINITY_DN2068_c0_g2_i1:617-1198(+)